MDGYFAQHQAGVEGYRMTINQSGPNYMIEEDHIGGQIINECNNTRSFETRFTHSPEGTPQNCLQNHAEAETTDSYPNTHQTYAYHTRIPSVTGFPRISFYELREDDDDDDDGPDYDAYQPTGDRHQGDRLNTLMVDGSTFRQKFEEGDDS